MATHKPIHHHLFVIANYIQCDAVLLFAFFFNVYTRADRTATTIAAVASHKVNPILGASLAVASVEVGVGSVVNPDA